MSRFSSLFLPLSIAILFLFGQDSEISAQELRMTRLIAESVIIPSERGSFISRYGLTRDDLRRITQSVPSIATAIPSRAVPTRFRYSTEVTDANLLGTTKDYSRLIDSDQLTGRFLLDKDVLRRNNVAVIGAGVVRDLFGSHPKDVLGRNLKIGNDYYLIVGYLKNDAIGSGDEREADFAHTVWIPLTTMRSRMGDDSMISSQGTFEAVSYELSRVDFILNDTADPATFETRVRDILKQNHARQDYRLRVAKSVAVKHQSVKQEE